MHIISNKNNLIAYIVHLICQLTTVQDSNIIRLDFPVESVQCQYQQMLRWHVVSYDNRHHTALSLRIEPKGNAAQEPEFAECAVSSLILYVVGMIYLNIRVIMYSHEQ
ncbi:hypothetical protein ASPSYDRAFT_782123 [Aspergillus sydowii CBS 593.65]|uniref:Uncharacterized protein n=1 Tax=Aspergillus sydowii CBS 593.65 TaxID=1036612 RepID=A0A1L9TNH2_9EURO|nr:uncharacterized protein ASPSYDRAFT_782123 [Aspergillus sydowii CBS 593.65]OJJ60999.1 hypothetical protein ASPSYDRAFT_782123 [Aspergillus sydowii CBS 593.65]